jgi:carbamate kinase
MSRLVLIAVGGNALVRADEVSPKAGEEPTAERQFTHAIQTADVVVKLIKRGYRVVLTHGNGPQVGAMLMRSERSAHHAYRMPLDCCVAATQGEIGYYLQYAMWQMMQRERVHVPVVSLVTQVRVDKNDPAFQHPAKPIGPFYTKEFAERYQHQLYWTMVEDSHGYRRAVSSPEPKEIIELDAIRACVDRGLVVIAGGGGGIPVFNDHQTEKGVEAVIDKDLTSAILAQHLHADIFAIATEVENVCVDFGKPTQRPLDEVSPEEMQRYYDDGQFPEGSMGPKVKAALRFLAGGGERVVITDINHLFDAIVASGGTTIYTSTHELLAA